MTDEPVFRIRGLCKSYGDKVVLDGIDFDVRAGECLVVLGRSGSGKSVTLRHLNGLERPDRGSVVFEGADLAELEESELFPFRRKIAMLFQSGALFDSMTVADNIAFPLREHTDLDEDAIAEEISEKLAMVELDGIQEKMPSELSGGMRKRVALARSLALDPGVVLFDEPTTGLDPMTAATIAHFIGSAREKLGVTSVIVTHDLSLTERVATRIAFLSGGRFRFLGTPAEAEASDDDLLRRFLAGEPDDGAGTGGWEP